MSYRVCAWGRRHAWDVTRMVTVRGGQHFGGGGALRGPWDLFGGGSYVIGGGNRRIWGVPVWLRGSHLVWEGPV